MFVVPPTPMPLVPVIGVDGRFPVHRIYCVGRNYAEHAREMGAEIERELPTIFMKPGDAVWLDEVVPYPPGTGNLHHEVELVVALGAGGRDIDADRALDLIYGYALGLDLTRRDLQAAAKARGNPWDVAKGFDASAPMTPIVPAATLGHPRAGRLWLAVNGIERQAADIGEMIFPVTALLSYLSRLFALKPGDLVFTGTPAGVGPLRPGDRFAAGFPGLPPLEGRIA